MIGLTSAVVPGAASVAAATGAPIPGRFESYGIGSTSITDLLSSDGSVLYLTSTGEVGTVSGNGTLHEVGTFPTASVVLVGSGPSGIWAYMATASGCEVSLMSTSGHVTSWTFTQPAQSFCHGGTVDPQGNAWVSLQGSTSGAQPRRVGRIGMISAAGVITEQAPSQGDAQPGAMAVGSDGAIWVAQRRGSLGRYTQTGPGTTTSEFGRSFLLPLSGQRFWTASTPRHDVALTTPTSYSRAFFPGYETHTETPDGALWGIGGHAVNGLRLLRLDPTLQLTRTVVAPVPLTGTLAAAADGSLWALGTQGSMHYLVHFVPAT